MTLQAHGWRPFRSASAEWALNLVFTVALVSAGCYPAPTADETESGAGVYEPGTPWEGSSSSQTSPGPSSGDDGPRAHEPGSSTAPTGTKIVSADSDGVTAIRTGAEGIVAIETRTLGKTVQVEVKDQAGRALDGIDVILAEVDGRVVMYVSDPSWDYAPAMIVHLPGEGGFGTAYGGLRYAKSFSTQRGAVVVTAVGVAVILYKVVLATMAAKAVVDGVDGVVELADFHMDNLHDLNLVVTTYCATAREIADAVLALTDVGRAVVSVVTAGAALAKEKALEVVMGRVADALLEESVFLFIKAAVGGLTGEGGLTAKHRSCFWTTAKGSSLAFFHERAYRKLWQSASGTHFSVVGGANV